MSKIQANQIQHTQNGAAVFTLPTSDGSNGQVLKSDGSGNLGFVAQTLAGITEFDIWTMTGNHSADSGADLNNNLSRWNPSTANGAAAKIGTGMTKDTSTGVFTFPSTGLWVILSTVHMYLDGDDNAGVGIKVSEDGGTNFSYNSLVYQGQASGSSTAHSGTNIAYIDVTNTSNVKVKFSPNSLATNSYITGDANYIRTHFTFIRIGDT